MLGRWHYYAQPIEAGSEPPTQTWSEYVLAIPSLVGFWRLGESFGATTAVDAKGTQNGTYVGTPTLGASGSITGSTAMQVNGTDQYASIADNNAWSPTTTTQLTVAIAAYPNLTAHGSYLITKGTDAQFEWEIARRNDAGNEGFSVLIRQAAGTTVANAEVDHISSWQDGLWYLVVMTIDTTAQVLDLWAGAKGGTFAKRASDTTWSGSMTAGTSVVEIGRRNDNSGDFIGTLDEALICSAKLSDAVLAELFAKWSAA